MEFQHRDNSKKIIRLTGLVIFLFIIGPLSLFGQTYYFDQYSSSEELGSSKVYRIIQDRKDYLWLGTGAGLSRFDGSKIENFSASDGLAAGGVMSLFEDESGDIWFGHLDGGLSIWDGDSFYRLEFDTTIVRTDINSIRRLDDRMWFTTRQDGAVSAIYDPVSRSFSDVRQYKGSEGLSDQVSGSFIDSEGILYCLAEVGIKKYLPAEDRFENYRPEGLTGYFTTIAMFEDSRGERWFGTFNGGLYRLKLDGTFAIYDIRDGLSKNWISYITEDSRGRIWVGTWGGGITVFDGEEMRIYDNTNGLKAMEIQCLLEDHEGNMLIGSQYEGLLIFKGDHFVNYVSDRILPDKSVWAINEDRYNRIWFGSNAGITIYDPETGMSWFYDAENKSLQGKIRYIKSDLDGNVWVGTDDSWVYRYDYATDRFIHADDVNRTLYHDRSVTAMAIDRQNNLWVGTNDGVTLWNIGRKEGRRYTRIDGLSGLGVKSLWVGKDGKVWIGTERNNGLTCYDPETGTFSIVDLGGEISPTSITETVDGSIWIGTSFGVYGLQGDTLFTHLTIREGLISNNISMLQPDNNGYLYIGTNMGLNRFSLESGKVNTYTRRNGLVGIETKSASSFRDSKGHLWFGTTNGVSCLLPEEIPAPDLNPLTHIKGILVNFESERMKEGEKFNYRKKSFVFDYYSICLTNPEAVRYKVMLEGADPMWRPETADTRAIYSALPPGRYTFKVIAVNSDGVWNEQPATYSFTIKPPFYFSPWFIIGMVILLVFLIVTYIKYRERKLILEKKVLEEKVEERTAEVVQKSLEIEEKNRDITASIRYAERIQMAMLPPEDTFNESFVLFKPKDIVSGDFYWMHDTGDKQFIAAVDCTGHGVPGAFMSIIGFNSLTKIVREYGITRPSAILDQLNTEVTRSLLQRGEKVINDGMDLALASFDMTNGKVEYAGAYNPLVIVRNGEAITIKADRFPIGMATEKDKKFTNNEVEVTSGDMIYMFSDGFADQFGGPESKKFKALNLKNEFEKIASLPTAAQKEHLLEVLEEWMGGLSQVDDILIIGTRIP